MPNLGKPAAQGVKLHQGYATAATWTPSWYSLLKGAYPWRNPILFSKDPMIIAINQPMLQAMLKDAGIVRALSGSGALD